MIRILLVDDQNLVQQGIKSLLDRDPEIEVIATVTDGRSAVTKISELQPDVVLLDIEMPGMNGITVTKYITHLAPQTKVIILSSHEEKKYLTQALMAGAKAYVLKSSLMADLKQSIIAVNSGYSHIESRLLAKIFDPNNFKLSNGKTATPRSSKPAQERSQEAAVKSAIAAKNVVADLGSSSLAMQDKSVIPASASSKTNKTVPKISLLYSEATPQGDLDLVDRTAHAPSPAQQNSIPQPSSSVGNRYYRTFRVAVNGKGYIPQLKTPTSGIKNRIKSEQFWKAKILPYRPIIDRSRSRMVQYQQRIMPLLKEWHRQGWLANLGLGVVGLVAVIIVQQIFS